MDEREKLNERYRKGQGPDRVNPRLVRYLPLLTRGCALDLAAGVGQNAALLTEWDFVVLVDISDEALARATGNRVLARAEALPFVPATFDTIVNTNFFDPRVDLPGLLRPGGTLFFETFTLADARYRPEFNPAHRIDPSDAPSLFRGLEILVNAETDDGHRVYATIVARKPK